MCAVIHEQLLAEIPWRSPKLKTKMWTFDESGRPRAREEVGVFVYWTGTMADMPMRCKVYKRLSWSAYLGCGQCGLRGVRHEGMNLLGCVSGPTSELRYFFSAGLIQWDISLLIQVLRTCTSRPAVKRRVQLRKWYLECQTCACICKRGGSRQERFFCHLVPRSDDAKGSTRRERGK